MSYLGSDVRSEKRAEDRGFRVLIERVWVRQMAPAPMARGGVEANAPPPSRARSSWQNLGIPLAISPIGQLTSVRPRRPAKRFKSTVVDVLGAA